MHSVHHWIDNKALAALQGEASLPVISPANEQTIAHVPLGSASTVNDAVASAAKAFESWRCVSHSGHAKLQK
jgi:acyl-CoA reductase-like NAD-dependent aldehyde dehydrogenase